MTIDNNGGGLRCDNKLEEDVAFIGVTDWGRKTSTNQFNHRDINKHNKT